MHGDFVLEGEEAQWKAKRHLERESGRKEATADMSEDLSEGEKGDVPGDLSAHGGSVRGRMSRISSVDVMENWANQHREKKLYIVLISLHGLIRGENMELGRDSDTGGQVKYVVELARALGNNARGLSGELGESSGSYIIRIPFGPKDKYIRKELLWPYIPEFVDGALGHIMQMSKVLGEQIGGGNPVWPVAIHGHYADAGDSAALLSGALNVPLVFTGHSLGRDKLEQLMKQGRQSREEINSTYKIMRRIEAEELTLDASEIIITSTKQEIEEQWRLYDGFDPVLERKLRARIKRGVSCHGRFMPRTVAIPPGMEFHDITPHDGDSDGEEEKNKDHPASPDQPIWSEIMRFFSNPRKPMILALARPDPKKNITTLVKAFGECRQLRELANLTLIMGNRDDIDQMSGANASYLLSIIKLVDKYDLYGQVAYPKHHKQSDVPDIYRLAAKTKGVFINPAFIEPFGLTLIEAAAYGLPIVATKNGGPVDIHRVLDNGLLVDPHDQQSIADALLKLVSDKQLWARCSLSGRKMKKDFKIQNQTHLAIRLRDIQDLSLNLKLSLDGEKNGSGNLDNSLDNEDNAVDGKNKLENAVLTLSKGAMGGLRKDGDKVRGDDYTTSSKFPSLRRRKYIFVIAVDCDTTSDFLEILKMVVGVANVNSAGLIGFILSTAMTISEINSLLNSGGLNPLDFDAFFCNSGSNLYYPSSSSVDSGLPFVLDLDYHSQIEYRWGGEGLRKTLVRWAISVNDKNGQGKIVEEDEPGSSSYCFALKVKDSSLVIPPVKELRKLMRIQALRCHVIYCQQGAKINVIPVLASRSQALRYLHVRWGTELSNIVVFTGECGDTDYEGLLGGLHKTVVLKGVGRSSLKLHANRSYPLEDVTPFDNPNLVQAGGCNAKEIKESLEKLGILKG
ncbi:hypothetical protein OIU76_027480 [Salix suchowensis]|nr:hypothetical protein OIU76_027480 [Salix suchowensis]